MIVNKTTYKEQSHYLSLTLKKFLFSNKSINRHAKNQRAIPFRGHFQRLQMFITNTEAQCVLSITKIKMTHFLPLLVSIRFEVVENQNKKCPDYANCTQAPNSMFNTIKL